MSAVKSYKLTDLFSWGNGKMGDKVLTWSIPAILTCPGRSTDCEKLCYADKNFFRMANVKSKYHRNWQLSQQNDFHLIASELLKKVKDDTLFRIHVAGDFYDATYAEKWLYILKQNPHVQAWVYTRSWRIPEILPVIEDLTKLPNLSFWYSVDRGTGKPAKIPKNVRTAYMMVDDADIPRWRPDLYFRDYAARGTVAKYIKGTLVCPAENGVSGHVQCQRCQICIVDPLEHPEKRTHKRNITDPLPATNRRIALATV